MATNSREAQAAALLAEIGPVRHISVFGFALLAKGILQSDKNDRYGITAQGAALLAGRWLRRLEKAGRARKCSEKGWLACPATRE